MLANYLLLASSLLSWTAQAQETVLGIYIFHRHGDRTTKAYSPTVLTDLGYQQIWQAGNYYRSRYISNTSTFPIYSISHDLAKFSQLNVQSPLDAVLNPSANGFLQGLYPPVGTTLGSQSLANGSSVTAPLNGYQLVPVGAVAATSTSNNAESTTWLQGSSGCGNAVVSSNNYFFSQDYLNILNSTRSFYQSIVPVVNGTFNSTTTTFKNAYGIYDFIHVSMIHNQSSTIPSNALLTPETVFQLQTLADSHEFNLAYNASEPIRAIAGSTLAAQIVQQLNATITGKSKQPVGIQFGAYASFLSFFGLAQLPSISVNFTGVVDYASSMTFELVTNATVSNTSYPTSDQISVRFLFSNGSAAANPLTPYPLFGQSSLEIPWNTFVSEMNKFAIGDEATWCNMCGNTTGICALSTSTSSTGTPTPSPTSSSSGMSTVVAGVIGAMVTLAVILGVEAFIMLLAGLRLVNKKRLAGTSGTASSIKA